MCSLWDIAETRFWIRSVPQVRVQQQVEHAGLPAVNYLRDLCGLQLHLPKPWGNSRRNPNPQPLDDMPLVALSCGGAMWRRKPSEPVCRTLDPSASSGRDGIELKLSEWCDDARSGYVPAHLLIS